MGFESNLDGLARVLLCVHEFVQFRTLWKFAVLASHAVGKKLRIERHAELEYFEDFLKRYADSLEICENVPDGVQAGFTRVMTD